MVVSLLIAVGTRAQWTTNGSNIYNSNSGAVGIGIITPQEKLHVEGNFYLNTGSFIIDQTASTDAKFYFKNVGNYEWDLGMETSDPTHNFYLYNRSNATYPITISKANVPTFKSDKIRLEGMASGGGINIWDIKYRDIIDNDFGIYNASQSAYRLDINNLGNVGIGTTTPLEKLHVNGRFYINSGTDYNNIYWGGHFMTMGTRPGDYSHNIFRLQPGGSSSGLLESVFEMFNANNVNSYTQTVQIRSNDISYFNGGNVGIGTATPEAKLAVSGQVHAQEVKVSVTVPGPDYVFEQGYKLPTLNEIKTYIDQNKHLPEVLSAADMEKNGVQLGEMNMLLLKKVEELTLYQIQSVERIQKLEEEIAKLKSNSHD